MNQYVMPACATVLLLAAVPDIFAVAGVAAPAYSVEELPIDKFDEYQAGSLPPAPWLRLKPAAPGVDFALRTEGESPFVGNKVTGKGLTMTISSSGAGAGDGIERKFTPAPPGDEFFAFDFVVAPPDSAGRSLDLVCELVDSQGKGLTLTIGTTSGLVASSAAGDRHVSDIEGGVWHHLTATISASRTVALTVTRFGSKTAFASAGAIGLPDAEPPDTLRLRNAEAKDQHGSWTVDNILMAGQVDTSRATWWPFDQVPLNQLRASDKKVFIYYFPIYTAGPTSEDPSLSWYSRTIMNPTLLTKPDRAIAGTEFEYCPLPYPPGEKLADAHAEFVRAREHEVRLARQMGIDGFFVDVWAFPNQPGEYFNEQAISLMEASARIDPGFKIIPAIYGPEEATDDAAVKFANSSIIKRVLAQPNLYKLDDGRVVISSWYPERYPASWWAKALAELEKNGTRMAFVPQFNSTNHLKEFSPISYGMANWGPRTPGHYGWVSSVKGLTTKTVFPIVEQDVRTRGGAYFESCGSELFRDLWSTAIGDNADWAFINTWSDYTEQAQAPSRAVGFAPFDIDAYYTQWFKTNKQPEIKRDVLYYFYRIQHSRAVPAHAEPWTLLQPYANCGKTGASGSFDQIELLAFLKAQGRLSIQVDEKVYTVDAPAGITSFVAPLPAGKTFAPVFSLTRGKEVVLSRAGQYSVLDKVEFGNMVYHSGVITPAAAE